ncbi:thiol-disulfide isomerase [Pseudomonas sp. S75]|uniref:DUF6436 domain-containing protein n=1 Tax=unclassified Pseudomonas TaxID=196821 RepID=UPI001907497C|nr:MULTISPECIES: DUF6436 domain-containing protein [unclassified Pseudomonas]MBJ9974626.1 thiol-disulfide isomerase [Pseudomonas sp. S30]MBK0153405.1 thiol-disulfide isomerase [Pseudomonas sp. S75]
MPHLRHFAKTFCKLLGVLLCAIALWWAYARFQSSYLRPFDDSIALFDGGQLRLPDDLAGPGPVRVVHFWDPACPCNVGIQDHLGEVIERFSAEGVTFHVLRKPGSAGQLPTDWQRLLPITELHGSDRIPASPAVAIWDRQGHLAYFGPYGSGAVCNSGNSFIEPVLRAVLQGRRVEASNALASGCYCPWGS